MRNTAVVRQRSSSVSAAIDSTADRPQTPHLYQPGEADFGRDVASLFNLKRRPGYYNAEAKAALLRRARGGPHDELLIDFSGKDVRVRLTVAGEALAIGAWAWQTMVAGEPLVSEGTWREVGWKSDKAFDYLEIELPLAGGWKLIRQMLLAREDRFLLLADALIGSGKEPVELRYSHSLPMAAEATFDPARETREGWLGSGGRRQATVVPPGLAEWRCEFSHSELLGQNGRLTLQQAALGRSLYAPLWIDLDPRRLGRPLTWRRLTVGENVANVSRDVAAGYRIQAGREQWLVYRSLGQNGNRSVLGYNTVHSFDCLRIVANGETEEIVAVG